ncbi:hypothetical protein GC169_09565 [bacterium]|nr:hypothetical protein [bacterium]
MQSNAKLAQYLAKSGRLPDVFVVDVGYSQGIDPALRQMEPALAGIGIDPLVPEIERLTQIETNPKLTYIAAFAESDRDYPDTLRHSTNWYARSQSNLAINPDHDPIGDVL